MRRGGVTRWGDLDSLGVGSPSAFSSWAESQSWGEGAAVAHTCPLMERGPGCEREARTFLPPTGAIRFSSSPRQVPHGTRAPSQRALGLLPSHPKALLFCPRGARPRGAESPRFPQRPLPQRGQGPKGRPQRGAAGLRVRARGAPLLLPPTGPCRARPPRGRERAAPQTPPRIRTCSQHPEEHGGRFARCAPALTPDVSSALPRAALKHILYFHQARDQFPDSVPHSFPHGHGARRLG